MQTLSHSGVSEVEEDTEPRTEEQPIKSTSKKGKGDKQIQDEDTQPLTEEQSNKSTSKKRKGEKNIQDGTKKKKKTVKVIHTHKSNACEVKKSN